jgi:hypothetical protein
MRRLTFGHFTRILLSINEGDSSMETEKHWLTSKTIWASVLQVAAGIAVAAGFFSQEAADQIVSTGPDLLAGIVVSVLGALSLYGRVVATTQITA